MIRVLNYHCVIVIKILTANLAPVDRNVNNSFCLYIFVYCNPLFG